MDVCPAGLDLRVKLVDVSGHGNDDAFCQNVLLSAAQISSESHPVLRLAERSLCLDAAVHPEHRPFFPCDPLQAFLPLLQESL